MDPRHSTEALKHLEKQNELLMEAYNSMSHELHKLKVEEEMLMRKFYEFSAPHRSAKKNEGISDVTEGQTQDSTALLGNATSNDSVGAENEDSTALVPLVMNNND
ncbi:uncharacterized protein LOC126654517 [Mercurialis annua]|uniref:uncharacterized protein LOC126654517 n=1 Tax=Mercurialis annua TaxID=3986 RepID=UPI00215F5F03|nr:uncharacterized protein LOC126654517 [Mercurialis annua]